MTSTGGDEHLSRIHRSLDRFRKDHDRLLRFTQVGVKQSTQLGVDDDETAPLLMSHSAFQAVNLAADCALALHRLCMQEDTITFHQYAHYSLARSGIEGAAQCIWLLAPEGRRERVARLLGVRAKELQKDSGLYRAMTKARATDSSSERIAKDRGRNELNARIKALKQWLADVSERNEFDVEHLELPTTFDMVEMATSLTGVRAEYGSVTWSVLSGLAHPSASRSLQFSRKREVGESRPGVVSVETTADHRTTMIAFAALESLLDKALDLLALRMLTPERRA